MILYSIALCIIIAMLLLLFFLELPIIYGSLSIIKRLTFFPHILGNWVLPSPFLISVINKFPTELNLKMFVFLSTGKTQQNKEKENPNNYPTPSQPPTVSASKLLYSV
jgi:hypothetical protein